MAWDTEATRRKLLEAGSRQFAAAGFAGARLDAIGRDAGVNKERVYKYFGDKRGLFAAVLEHELTELLAGLRIDEPTPEAVGEFAGLMFDRCVARPELPRLLAWESLELDDAVAAAARRPLCAANVVLLRTVLPDLEKRAAEQLLLSVISLVVSWWSLGRLAEVVLAGSTAHPPRGDAGRRTALVGQVTALVRGLG
jgi:AcrR family transcriptional regulator